MKSLAILATGALVLVGCGSTTGYGTSPTTVDYSTVPHTAEATLPPADTSWTRQIIADDTEITALLNRLAADATAGDTTTLAVDCAQGQSALPRWQGDASTIPSESIRTPYLAALGHFSASFSACVGGDYSGSAVEMTAGNASIQEASAAIVALAG